MLFLVFNPFHTYYSNQSQQLLVVHRNPKADFRVSNRDDKFPAYEYNALQRLVLKSVCLLPSLLIFDFRQLIQRVRPR
jgi:hypothetical protein